MQSTYDVGIYCRLSRDDNNYNLQSMSIQNQEQILRDFVTEKGWNLRYVFIDDGYSGTNFNRPDFKKLCAAVEATEINCVVTKDLSRLGRNYVQTGYYTDEYFPEMGVRYIAINDGIDTLQEDNEMMAFHHVVNEIYPKQVSKKVRQVKTASAKQGKFMGSQAPYGYMKHPNDKHVLIPDPLAADVVRRIFKMYADGESARSIADSFNAEGLDSPRFYHYAKAGKVNPLAYNKNCWGSATIMQLMKNEVYIGNMVQGKRRVISFKTKKRKQIDEDQWISVKNTHEPLVPLETWEIVQSYIRHKRIPRVSKTGTIGLFSGVLRCADCGSRLTFDRRERKHGEVRDYRCSKYMNNGRSACTTHLIHEETLESIVLQDIRAYASLAVSEQEALANKLLASLRHEKSGLASELSTKKHALDKRLAVIDSSIKTLYEDRCSGTIPEDVFKSLLSGYVDERTELHEVLPEIEAQLKESSMVEEDITAWVSRIASFQETESLDRPTIMRLIDFIEVSEIDHANTEPQQRIKIKYRFARSQSPKNEKNIAEAMPFRTTPSDCCN